MTPSAGAASSFRLDVKGAEIRQALEAVGVRPILIKGPAFARLLYADLFRSLDDAVVDAEERTDRMMAEPDFREGVSAFAEKRPPRFADLPPPPPPAQT